MKLLQNIHRRRRNTTKLVFGVSLLCFFFCASSSSSSFANVHAHTQLFCGPVHNATAGCEDRRPAGSDER